MSMSLVKMQHGVICYFPGEPFGYFGWPSIASQSDGTLVVAASGFRREHVCPWGKTVICRSFDKGENWTYPQVINDTPLDDRDAGIISLGGQRLAVTWFTSNTTVYHKPDPIKGWPEENKNEGAILDTWDLAMCNRHIGSWIRVSLDGYYWGEAMKVPVNTPHGFIVLKDASWLYLGKSWEIDSSIAMFLSNTQIVAMRSEDEGKSWQKLGTVPLPDDCAPKQVHEPHVLELDNGDLLGAIRTHSQSHKSFRTTLTRSSDGGKNWEKPIDCGTNGSPPHLLKHSSGAIVLVYGYRMKPFGQRAKISYDEGYTWSDEIILRDDGPSLDLGYPASIELPDGDILTIYYQALKDGDPTGLLYTKWQLPEL
jgi:sialidase-1